MFDARLRPLIDPALDVIGRRLLDRGLSADQVTVGGFAFGLAGALAIAFGQFGLGLALIVVNRLADGVDGAIARATAPTDAGGFLDISLDFVFYASVPLAFAAYDPDRNALAAALLIASFLINGTAFLSFAIAAARRGIVSTAQGPKSFYYMAGLAEGGETVAAFFAFCIWPSAFPILAMAFAALCLVSGIARIVVAWHELR